MFTFPEIQEAIDELCDRALEWAEESERLSRIAAAAADEASTAADEWQAAISTVIAAAQALGKLSRSDVLDLDQPFIIIYRDMRGNSGREEWADAGDMVATYESNHKGIENLLGIEPGEFDRMYAENPLDAIRALAYADRQSAEIHQGYYWDHTPID